MAVVVPILSSFDDKGIKAAVREFQTAKTQIQKFSAVGSIFEGVGKSLSKNLTAPIVAVTGALGFMVKAGMEVEAQQHRLRQILTTTGGASHSQVDALLAQASALEKVGVASRDSIIQTQSQLATFDLQASTIERLTPAVLDYVTAEKGATATTEDFKAMTNGLAQAMQGNFASLTRTGFVLDDATKKMISSGTEAERAAAIVDVLNSTYKGFNASLLNTPEGQMIKLQQEFQNIREELGQALIPVFNDLVRIIRSHVIPFVQNVANNIKNWSETFKNLDSTTRTVILVLIGFAAALGPMLILIGKSISLIVTLTKVFRVLALAFAANPIGFIVTALALMVAGLVTAYQTSEKFRNIVNRAINAVITVVENLANGFIEAWNKGILPVFNKILSGLKKINPEIELLGETGEISFKRVGNATKSWAAETSEMSAYAKELGGITATGLTPAVTELSTAMGGAGSAGSGGAAKKTEKLKDRLKELRKAAVDAAQAVVNNLNESLRSAQSQLDDARRKFDDFKNAISGTITGILNFGKAAEGENFIQGLIGQANDATAFAGKIKQLIQLGLSERGIQEVLKAGYEAGSRIADELISGGTTIVQQVNTLLASVVSVADQVGDFGAREFYQAGVTQGEALVNGILDSLRAAQAELAAAQRAAVSGGSIGDFKNLGARATGLLGQIQGLSGKAQANALADFSRALEQSKGAPAISKKELATIQQKYKLAKGGIVMGPTNALIGEAGPEAVIPLSGANSARGALGANINITVNAGVGTDGALVGRQIVDAIRKYERTSGPVFAKA